MCTSHSLSLSHSPSSFPLCGPHQPPLGQHTLSGNSVRALSDKLGPSRVFLREDLSPTRPREKQLRRCGNVLSARLRHTLRAFIALGWRVERRGGEVVVKQDGMGWDGMAWHGHACCRGFYAFCFEADVHIFHSPERARDKPTCSQAQHNRTKPTHTRTQWPQCPLHQLLFVIPPHNQIPIILSRQRQYVTGIELAFILWLDLPAPRLVSPSSLISSLPALIMKCNYWMPGGRRGVLPGRRGVQRSICGEVPLIILLSLSFSGSRPLHVPHESSIYSNANGINKCNIYI